MKKLWSLVLIAFVFLLAGNRAKAELVLTLDQSSYAALPGQTVTFSGNLWYKIFGSTPADDNGIQTGVFGGLFLNGADFPLLQTGLIGSVQPFIENAPEKLMPNQSLPGSIDLFSIKVNNGLKAGIYEGEFRVLGGRTANSYEELARVGFLVTVGQSSVPEPGTLSLIGAGLLSGSVLVWRRKR